MGKTPPVLPWMRHPIEIDSYEDRSITQVPFLHPRLREALEKMGIPSLFPVQAAVWHQSVGPGAFQRDLCICSPTGSGKTLAYAIPIAQLLSARVLRLLRALVVVPTRDLAMQVKDVFDAIAPFVGLSVGLAVGQSSVSTEASQLVQIPNDDCTELLKSDRTTPPQSKVDILIATPGRLMDHIKHTQGFSLEHVQYLVVDEIDRLLREAYQEWLPNVLEAVGANKRSENAVSYDLRSGFAPLRTFRHLTRERGLKGCVNPRIKKMILSATLTRDPAKIAQLTLYHPLYISSTSSDHLYKLPEQLQSYKLVCKAEQKPLKLVSLLHSLGKQRSIVFTASVVNTHRLYVFLNSFEGLLPLRVVEYSSLQHQQDRSKALAAFRTGEADVIVASDALARGMDVECVTHIINYDAPAYAKTYVHRVGRTARAGKSGSSFTLLRKQEVKYFKSVLGKIENSSCKSYKLPVGISSELYSGYSAALDKLKEVIENENVQH